MKDNRHKEPRQKPWGQAERIQTGSRLPKTIAREAWVKSKENLIPAKRTNPDSNYAYAQEMEEDSVQQVENCLEDATLLTLQKAGAAYKDRIACKRELHKPHQEGSLYRNTLEPREKETVVREPSKTNPQGTSKQEQQRCTAQKQIEQQVKKVAREIRGVDIDQKQLRTAANTARKGKKAGQVTQRTQRMIYRAKQAAGESAEATKKGIAVIRSAIRHWMTAMQSLAAALIAGGWVSVFIILLMCLIALVAGSAYGIFFAAESPDENAISVQEAVELLTEEYRDRLEEIENSVECDRQKIESNDGSYAIVWQDVLAVFSSYVSGNEQGTPVAALTEEQVDKLRETMWAMNAVDCSTHPETTTIETTDEDGNPTTTEITETVLVIELTHKTPDEMAADYHFTTRQNTYLQLLQDPQYEELWAELLGGFAQGGGELMNPDSTRIPTGTLQWPLPVAGTITSQFGHRVDPITGEVSSHTGTDIACAEGTPILAAADGVVTVANGLDSWGGSYGYYIQIDHGGGLETLYAHCSSICVTTGQQVQAGQVIGYVGHTGRATGDHLHFEIVENGQRQGRPS